MKRVRAQQILDNKFCNLINKKLSEIDNKEFSITLFLTLLLLYKARVVFFRTFNLSTVKVKQFRW